MTPIGRSVLVLAGLAAAGCGLWSRGGFAQEMRGLPRCPGLPTATPSGWTEHVLTEGFSISLPPCFRQDDAPDWQPPHGGTRWRCDDGRVAEVVWGMWGQDSFSEDRNKCTAHVGGRRVMVGMAGGPDRTDALVWYSTGWIHEPVVSAWSPRPDDQDVRAIVLSGRVGSAR